MSEHTAEELLRRLEERQHEVSTRALAEFDDRTLCLLSLLPEWTPELADRLELDVGRDLAGFVDRLAWADLAEFRAAGGQPVSFWIRARRRLEVGDHLREKMGVDAVVGCYTELCSRVARLDPPELRSWLQVRAFHADPSGRELLNRIEALLHRRDLPAAATMVATARVVCEVVGGPLEDAVKRAQWRLDREYRTRDDLGHLTGYHRRAEIEDALTDLVTGDDGPWALHLFGNAGVGKTMTVRYLASGKLAEDHGMPRFPVARVDFDHLDPRYPERRPAELLVALTDELLGFATTRGAEHRYRAIRDVADAVHEELSRADPDPATVAGLRMEVIDRFADFAGQLPSPVVLVLDTCEELAKLYPAGAEAPAIDRTFDLLRSLHERHPAIRVVLAGRRLLVKPADGTLYSGPKLYTRDYVRVVPISGFSREDALGYLVERGIPERLHPTLLTRSADGVRYNPFELAGLCDWVRDEPGLDLAELSATVVDPYVERRILSRIQDQDVIAALPVAVALGEFDRALVTPALTRLGVDVAAAFDGLSGQEWVNVRGMGADGMPRVLEVDEHIRERLRAVLERSDRPAADLAALGRDAAEVIRQGPLPSVSTATVVAAVRLLPTGEAARLWAEIDRRVLLQGEWGWATQVAPRVAAMEKDRPGPKILAAVLATEASARIHTGYREGLHQLWDAVAGATKDHPPGVERIRLELRARLGKVAAVHEVGESSLTVFERFRDPAVDAELEDAVLAALENAVVSWPASSEIGVALWRLADGARSPQIAAGAAVVLAGLWVDRGTGDPVEGLLDARIAALEHLPDGAPQVWRDWVRPRGLLNRLRLVRVLTALNGGEPLDEQVQLALIEESRYRDEDIDADRLHAALLDHQLARGNLEPAPAGTEIRLPSGDPVTWLHYRFGRPYLAAAADVLILQGRYREAAGMLDEARLAAIGSGDDAELVDALDLALLRVCRAARTTEYAPVQTLAYDGSPRLRDEAWLVLRLLGEADDPRWAEYCSPYGRWRCKPRGDLPDEAFDWPADHVDFWELTAFGPDADDDWYSRIGELARGRSELMAGEIHAVLGSWQTGRGLLERAEERFVRVGYQRGVDQVRGLLAPAAARPEPRPPSRWRSFAAWLRAHCNRQSVADFRQVLRRWFAIPTRGSYVFFAGLGLGVGGGLAVLLVALGVPTGWVIGAALVPVLLAHFILYAGRSYDMRRLVVTPEGETLTLQLLPEQLPWLLGREPKKPSVQARLETPFWTGTGRWPADGSSEGLDDVPTVLEGLTEQIVTLLQIPRELQFAGRWERALAAGVLAESLPRVVYVRWLPGAHGAVRLPEWRQRTEAFRGPLRLRPNRAWADVPGPRRLVHLVGTPVRTSAGWHFRVRDASGRAARASSRGADRREELFDLHTVTRDPVGLLVLQADPTDGAPLPLGRDHDGFVRAASAAMDNGTDAVLVVPPLPDDVAREAVQLVWHAIIAAELPDLRRLVDLAGDIKMLVHRAERGTTETPTVSVDVLLFARATTRGGS